MKSPVTMASCDGDSDSSHVTGSCSPGDSVHDVPRAPKPRRERLSRSLFPAGSPDVQPPRTSEERQSTLPVMPTPLTGWCRPPFVVDHRSTSATNVLPELLGSEAYCRLAAAAAASIAGIYWGRQCDEKPGVDLMLSRPTLAAAAAGFSLPTIGPNYPSTADNPASATSLLDGSSWLGMMKQDLQTDDGLTADKVVATPDSRSGSPSSVDDDLPLDLSPVAKRVHVKSPLTGVVAADGCSV